jgi:hypothetical protein
VLSPNKLLIENLLHLLELICGRNEDDEDDDDDDVLVVMG